MCHELLAAVKELSLTPDETPWRKCPGLVLGHLIREPKRAISLDVRLHRPPHVDVLIQQLDVDGLSTQGSNRSCPTAGARARGKPGGIVKLLFGAPLKECVVNV